jgi:hypothetical protein
MLCLLELHYCGVLSNQAFAQCSVYPSVHEKAICKFHNGGPGYFFLDHNSAVRKSQVSRDRTWEVRLASTLVRVNLEKPLTFF